MILLVLVLSLVGLLAGPLPPAEAQEPSLSVVRVGVIADGPWYRSDEVLGLVRQEIEALVAGEFDVRFPPEARISGEWSLSSVSAALDRLLADPSIDVVITLGVLASDNACRRGDLPKPVIAPFVIDPLAQELPDRGGTSGVRNLSYLTIPSTLERDLSAFREIVPFDRLVVLVNGYIAEAIPTLGGRLETMMQALGVTPRFLAVGESARDALAALPADAEAVYVYPLLQLSPASFDSLVTGLIDAELPSFSYFGEREVQRGFLAGLNPDLFPRMSRRVALNFQSILLGRDGGTIPTTFSAGERLVVNVTTAETINRYPGWAVLTEAELVEGRAGGDRGAPGEDDTAGPQWTLTGVMLEALRANPDLSAADRDVSAGAQGVKTARSSLLPQIDLSGLGLIVDEDRASSSFGTQAERTLSGTLSLTQPILVERAWAGLAIEASRQRARIGERDQARLDVVLEASQAYLNVLRAKTQERIRRENVGLSRTNLELARVRRSIGFSGPSDVLRWESEIATNRRLAIDANATRNLAEMELNRVLHRPLEEPFRCEDPVDRAGLLMEYPYLSWFENKMTFALFRDFLAREAIRRSPEAQSLDAALDAQRRSLASAGRRFWLPELALTGEVTRRFDRGGAGADPSSAIPGFDVPDDTDWNLGVVLSYPLFNGGGRLADRARARDELLALESRRLALADRIEQRVRSTLHRAGASFAGIRQAEIAADAAERNLELVTDAYSRGAVNLIDLIDAQNAFIVAGEAAANSSLDFLVDFMQVQRAAGRFEALLPEAERGSILTRLETFARSRGVDAPRIPEREDPR